MIGSWQCFKGPTVTDRWGPSARMGIWKLLKLKCLSVNGLSQSKFWGYRSQCSAQTSCANFQIFTAHQMLAFLFKNVISILESFIQVSSPTEPQHTPQNQNNYNNLLHFTCYNTWFSKYFYVYYLILRAVLLDMQSRYTDIYFVDAKMEAPRIEMTCSG